MANIMMIGIAGGTGSGKTTLAQRLCDAFGDSVCLIRHDSYYKRHDDLTYEEPQSSIMTSLLPLTRIL